MTDTLTVLHDEAGYSIVHRSFRVVNTLERYITFPSSARGLVMQHLTRISQSGRHVKVVDACGLADAPFRRWNEGQAKSFKRLLTA